MSDRVNVPSDEIPALEDVPETKCSPPEVVKLNLQDILTEPEPEDFVSEMQNLRDEVKQGPFEVKLESDPLENIMPEIFTDEHFDDTDFVSETIPEFRSDQNKLDLDVRARVTNALVPTEIKIESEDPADILADPNVTTILAPIAQEPYNNMRALSDMIAPVAMAITPGQSDDESEIDFQIWRPDDLIPAELDENKIQLTDDGDVVLTEPDNMQVVEKPFTQIFEGVVALPPEENMDLGRTRNIVLKRKQPDNQLANIKKVKNETDVRVRDVVPKSESELALPTSNGIVKHPIQRKLEKNMQKDEKLARIVGSKNNDTALVKSKPEWEMSATVDISTIRRLPWVDFDAILDNTDADRRQQVILDLLQNNMPDSAADIYYIYHDAKTNTYSIEVDENTEEVQNFIGSILLINARLEVEDLTDKERQTLVRKRKMKIKELKTTYGAHEATEILKSKLSETEKQHVEDEIVRIQGNLNQDRDNYYHIFNEETDKFELRFDQDVKLIQQIVSAILKLDDKIELDRNSASDR